MGGIGWGLVLAIVLIWVGLGMIWFGIYLKHGRDKNKDLDKWNYDQAQAERDRKNGKHQGFREWH